MYRFLAVSFFFFVSSLNASFSQNIDHDWRLIMRGMSVSRCVIPAFDIIIKRPDLVARIMGPTLVPTKFNPKTEKQKRYKTLIKSNKSRIDEVDSLLIAKYLDYAFRKECFVDPEKFKDVVFKEVMLKSYKNRRYLIDKVLAGKATYNDIIEFVSADAKSFEPILAYSLSAVDSGAFSKTTQNSLIQLGTDKALLKMYVQIEKILYDNYQISL